MFVIDTSLTMARSFEDAATEASDAVLDRLRDDQAVVPSIWPLDVANVAGFTRHRPGGSWSATLDQQLAEAAERAGVRLLVAAWPLLERQRTPLTCVPKRR